MGSEGALWNSVKRGLSPYGKLTRVENSIEPGTPDVAYCLKGLGSGWLELKHLPGWPQSPGADVVIRHLTMEQAEWMFAWERAGGRAGMILQVHRDYFYIPGEIVKFMFFQDSSCCRSDLFRYGLMVEEKGWFKSLVLASRLSA